jgi:hypothetical protein
MKLTRDVSKGAVDFHQKIGWTGIDEDLEVSQYFGLSDFGEEATRQCSRNWHCWVVLRASKREADCMARTGFRCESREEVRG